MGRTTLTNNDLEAVLGDVITNVFGIMLDLQITPLAVLELDSDKLERGSVVHVLGDWMGSVTFRCSPNLIETISSRIFHVDPSEVSDELKDDALRELANLLGGNLKPSLGRHSILSTPKTFRQIDSETGVQEGTEIAVLAFTCNGEPLQVVLYESTIELPDF